MQGPAVNFSWVNVECHIVLQLDHDDTCMKFKSDIFGPNKLCLRVSAVAAQRCIRWAVALLVVLKAAHCGLHGTGVGVPGYTVSDDFAFHSVFLSSESEGH